MAVFGVANCNSLVVLQTKSAIGNPKNEFA
jgi:hypothetical protein